MESMALMFFGRGYPHVVFLEINLESWPDGSWIDAAVDDIADIRQMRVSHFVKNEDLSDSFLNHHYHDSTVRSVRYLRRGYFWRFVRTGRRGDSRSCSPDCPSPLRERSKVWSALLSWFAASVAKSSCQLDTPMPCIRASIYWVTRAL